MVGLTRAFQYAGARSIVASLWKVADESTAELMARFYTGLRAGMATDEALRQAQCELIRASTTTAQGESGIDFSTPYHWAAFQLYGDWR
jgi:CHAT domain-containing protein